MNIINQFENIKKNNKLAIIDSKNGKSLSFKMLDHSISFLAHKMSHTIHPNDKVLLFVKPSVQFAPLVFALFKIGATPIMIDPGMGIKSLLQSIKQVAPDYMIAEPVVHLIKKLRPRAFRSIKKSFYPKSFGDVLTENTGDWTTIKTHQKKATELAAILFTSGGTGIPKGVEYTHEMLINQTKLLKETFSLTENDIDFPGFPLFALFTVMMGMTSVIPNMNPSRPAKANAQKLYAGIDKYRPTFIAGSPAIWNSLIKYCHSHNIKLPSVKYLVMFGAPVPLSLHQQLLKLLPNGTTYTPYGATESLPIACCTGKTILEQAMNAPHFSGIYLGKPLPSISLKIVKDPDNLEVTCRPFEIGEIMVSGPVVSTSYYQMPEETNKAKRIHRDQLWHRIGDVGYLDQSGALWFCGREAHKFEHDEKTYYSIPTELVFNNNPKIKKSALVQYKNEPAICILKQDKSLSLEDVKAIASNYDHTKEIKNFFFCKKFPVDVRHNIKIDRNLLGKNLNRYLL